MLLVEGDKICFCVNLKDEILDSGRNKVKKTGTSTFITDYLPHTAPTDPLFERFKKDFEFIATEEL